MNLDWGKARVVVAVAVFAIAGVGAWLYSKRLDKVGEFETEARTQLVRFASAMIRCGKNMPDTSSMVPEAFSSISGKPFQSSAVEWSAGSFSCSNFSIEGAQLLQYGWVKEQEGKGFVIARGDANADGSPDTWFEIPVTCPVSGCTSPNYIYEVDSDGTRRPPMLLRLLGRASTFLGTPPSLSPESPKPSPQARAKAKAVAATDGDDTKPIPEAPKLPGAGLPVALDALYFEGERRATSRQWGVALVLLEYEAVRGREADPKQGATMRAHYGVPDGTGRVSKNAATIVATFDANGFSVSDGRAPRSLKVIGFQECLPEQVVAATKLTIPLSLSLEWHNELDRPLWSIKGEGSTKPEHLSAGNCALVDVAAATAR